MGANKIILNNKVLIDLTADTVIESDVTSGVTFHKADGTPAVGTKVADKVNLINKGITANGTYSASDDEADGFSSVDVNVPIPEGYVKPEGSLPVNGNNTTIDVTQYAEISVATTQPREINLAASMINIPLVLFNPTGSVYKYTGETTESFENGELYKLCEDSEGNRYFEKLIIESEQKTTPQEIATEAEMTALLETAEVGTIYKYVGESGTYENGALYVVESNVTLISFTIEDAPYQAEEGMTWADWVANTTYNTDGYIVNMVSNKLSVGYYAGGGKYYYISTDKTYAGMVLSTDMIVDSNDYGLYGYSEGGGSND